MKTDQKSVVAEIKISYCPVIKPSQRPKVAASWEVHQLLKDNWDEEKLELQEQFKIMLLNRGNRVLGNCGKYPPEEFPEQLQTLN